MATDLSAWVIYREPWSPEDDTEPEVDEFGVTIPDPYSDEWAVWAAEHDAKYETAARTAHLAGRHDQKTHGRRGGGSAAAGEAVAAIAQTITPGTTLSRAEFAALRQETIAALDDHGYDGAAIAQAAAEWQYGSNSEFWRGEVSERTQAIESVEPERHAALRRGAEQAREIAAATRVDAPLYRGLGLSEDSAAALRAGQVLPNRGSSWSRSRLAGAAFAEIRSGYNAVSVLMMLSPGAHGLDLAALGDDWRATELEVFVADEAFRVVDASRDDEGNYTVGVEVA